MRRTLPKTTLIMIGMVAVVVVSCGVEKLRRQNELPVKVIITNQPLFVWTVFQKGAGGGEEKIKFSI